MQRASIVLGMSPATASDTGLRVASGGPRQFTDDVLVIEKYGCDLPLVNLVDLPGLFKAPDTTRQNEESQKMVFKMVQDYVRSQQNFILLVITARNTVYNHDGLNLVQEMTKEDPRLVSRVVGVVTNPDHALSLKETLSLLHGRHSSNVGRCKWHIVKNQDQTQRSRETLLQRDRNEEHFFLANDDWKGVPSELKGIAALHATLKDAFREHTRTALPSLMSKIQTKITTIDSGLRDLDCSRSTDHGRRQLLVKVAGRFAFFAREPCSGGYENPECKEFHSVEETCRDCEPFFPMAEDVANKDMEGQHTKLRANLRALNRAFSSAMLAYGKTKEMALASQSTSQPRVSGDQPSPHSAPPDQSAPDSSSPSSSSANPAIPTATYPAATTIRNYYTHNKPDAISPHEFEQSVAADLIPKSSGREPTGEASEAAYHALFIHQSSKWRQISGSHLKAVWEATEHFVQSALAAACPYPDLRDILEKRLIRPRIEALKSKSNRGLNDLLQCHSKGGTGFYDAIAGIKDAREKHEQQQTAVEDVVGSNEPDSDMQVGDMREESEDRNAIFDVLAKTVSDAVFDSLAAQTSIVSPIVLGPVREVVTQAVQGIVGSGFDLFVSATDKDKKMSTTSTEADAGADAPQEKQTAAGRVIQHVEENYEASPVDSTLVSYSCTNPNSNTTDKPHLLCRLRQRLGRRKWYFARAAHRGLHPRHCHGLDCRGHQRHCWREGG